MTSAAGYMNLTLQDPFQRKMYMNLCFDAILLKYRCCCKSQGVTQVLVQQVFFLQERDALFSVTCVLTQANLYSISNGALVQGASVCLAEANGF